MSDQEDKKNPNIGKGTKIWNAHLSYIDPEATIGENCVIHPFVAIYPGVKIGNGCRIQAHTFIPSRVIIGNNVFIGPGVTFTNDKYPPSGGDWSTTRVFDGASIGARATILPGITIGAGSRIGAGSVVTKNVVANVTVCGNPAAVHNKNG